MMVQTVKMRSVKIHLVLSSKIICKKYDSLIEWLRLYGVD